MIYQLRQIAKERGGRCLSDDCVYPHSIVWWECEQGHRWQASPIRVKLAKNWCPECAGRSTRVTIEELQDTAAKHGGRCLSEVYQGSQTKLLWECSKGHRWEALPKSVKNGSWCPSCAGNKRYTIKDMQRVAAERGGRCLSSEYINNSTKLLWECSEGHQWEAMPMKVMSGNWCRKCYNIKRTKHKLRRTE